MRAIPFEHFDRRVLSSETLIMARYLLKYLTMGRHYSKYLTVKVGTCQLKRAAIKNPGVIQARE